MLSRIPRQVTWRQKLKNRRVSVTLCVDPRTGEKAVKLQLRYLIRRFDGKLTLDGKEIKLSAEVFEAMMVGYAACLDYVRKNPEPEEAP